MESTESIKTALFRAKKKKQKKTQTKKKKKKPDKTVLFRTKKKTDKTGVKTMLGLRFAISLKKKAEKYSTSTCISTRKNDIHNSFEKYMIEELRSLIAGEVINQCHGCQVDHPRQK